MSYSLLLMVTTKREWRSDMKSIGNEIMRCSQFLMHMVLCLSFFSVSQRSSTSKMVRFNTNMKAIQELKVLSISWRPQLQKKQRNQKNGSKYLDHETLRKTSIT